MSNLNLQKLHEWVWPWPWTFKICGLLQATATSAKYYNDPILLMPNVFYNKPAHTLLEKPATNITTNVKLTFSAMLHLFHSLGHNISLQSFQ